MRTNVGFITLFAALAFSSLVQAHHNTQAEYGADGTFAALGIEASANLNGSAPIRAGTDIVNKLRDMGLLIPTAA